MKLLTVLLFFPVLLSSQNGFSEIYDLNTPGIAIANIIVEDEETLVITGLAIIDSLNRQGFFFAKIDTSGNVLSHHIYTEPNMENHAFGTKPSPIIKLIEEEGYLLTGEIFESPNSSILIKTDLEGSPVFYQEYIDTLAKLTRFTQILEWNGGYMIFGNKQLLNFEVDVFVFFFSKEGDLLWEKNIGISSYREALSKGIVKIDNNEIILGMSFSPFPSPPLPQYQSGTKFFAIDSLGNEKWNWTSELSTEEASLPYFYLDADGNYVYFTNQIEYNAMYNEIQRQPKLVKRDSDFNLLEAKPIGKMGISDQLFSFFPLENGDWLGVGRKIKEYDLSYADDVTLATGWLYRADAALDSIWGFTDTLYSPVEGYGKPDNQLYAAVELASGSIIACGYVPTYYPEEKTWGWLYKINADGCMEVLDCDFTVGSQEVEKEEVIKDILVFPNPATTTITISHQYQEPFELIIYNIHGVPVKATNFSATSKKPELDVSHLPTGVYFYHVRQQNNLLTTGKLILQ